MERGEAESRHWTRWRWRRRGAWQWPAFALFVLVDGVLLHRLPVTGQGPPLTGAWLLAGFLNLATVALVAPLLGRVLRRRRPDLPRVVASDYAGTALILVLAGVLVVLGIVHRPQALAERLAFRRQAEAVRAYVSTQASAVYRRHMDRADTWRLDDNLFRTCVPGADPRRALCLIVDTSQSPPGLRRDPNAGPNWLYIGPRASGRGRG